MACILLATAIAPPKASASDISNYYATAYGLSGTTLQQALHSIIASARTNDYSALHVYYQSTDARHNGTVWDMYSDVPHGDAPYSYPFAACEQCGNYRIEGDCYNREHSWPQSWFNSGSPMVSDLFHIYPTDGKVNSYRGNFPFGEVAFPTIVSLNGSKVGPCSTPGYAGTVFEPVDEYKGDFARTFFYMSTRYLGKDAGWQHNAAVSGAELKPWTVELLLRWHENDPVSLKEVLRNEEVYSVQSNRNPFIDHPTWVNEIWGVPTNSIPPLISIQSPATLLSAVPSTQDSFIVHGYACLQVTGAVHWTNSTLGVSGLSPLIETNWYIENIPLAFGENLVTLTASNSAGQVTGRSMWVFRRSGAKETFDDLTQWSGNMLCHKDWFNEFTTLRYDPMTGMDESGYFMGIHAAIKKSVKMDSIGYSWGINRNVTNAMVRHQTPMVVKGFSMYLAPYVFDATLQFQVRVSTNSGMSYEVLLSTNGHWLGSSRRFRKYESPPLNLIPQPGRSVYVELVKTSGEMMFLDDFDYSVEPNPDDLDMDTLPDSWEIYFFGDITVTDGSLDSDGDGYTDWEEFIAGTSPVDDQSFLKVSYTYMPEYADTIPIAWESIADRQYRIFGMTNLKGQVTWTSPLQGGSPPTNTYAVPMPTNSTMMFYGVWVE